MPWSCLLNTLCFQQPSFKSLNKKQTAQNLVKLDPTQIAEVTKVDSQIDELFKEVNQNIQHDFKWLIDEISTSCPSLTASRKRFGTTFAIRSADFCKSFNVGGSTPISLKDLATMLTALAGGRVTCVPWPDEKKAIDIGSFYADSSLFRSRTGWAPRVALRDGFTRTFDYYRKHLQHYVGHGSV